MEITVDISMYPLKADYKPAIKTFIRKLREYPGLQLVTNQLSTQITGEYPAVTHAINDCMLSAMSDDNTVVFVARYLNKGLDINTMPEMDFAVDSRQIADFSDQAGNLMQHTLSSLSAANGVGITVF